MSAHTATSNFSTPLLCDTDTANGFVVHVDGTKNHAHFKGKGLSGIATPLGMSSDTESVNSQFELTASTVTSLPISAASAPTLFVPQLARNGDVSLVHGGHTSQVPRPQPQISMASTAFVESEDPRKKESIVQRNVYISGLPSYMQSSEFRELCQRFGRVEASKLCVEGPSNPTKGYGFVLYYSEASAAACIKELSGSYLNGRCLQARLADTHATPHEARQRVLPPPPPPPPLRFSQPKPGAQTYPPFISHRAQASNSASIIACNTPSYPSPPQADVTSLNPQLPVQIVPSANAYFMNGGNVSAYAVPHLGPPATDGAMTMTGVYYACIPDQRSGTICDSAASAGTPLQAYRVAALPVGAARQVVLLSPPQQPPQQPSPPTVAYAASPAYFTAAAPSPGGYAAVPNVSFYSQPQMLSAAPSTGVQYISLTRVGDAYRLRCPGESR
jgi:RNA recognition motif-containing protein